jgi:excisionase family DNA binding protein
MKDFATKNNINPFETIQNTQNEILSSLKEIQSVLRIDGKGNFNSVQKKYYDVESALEYTGIKSRPAFYAQLHRNRIDSVKIGRRRYFTKDQLDAFMSGGEPKSILK